MTVYGEWEMRNEIDEATQEEKEREMAEHLATLAEMDPWFDQAADDARFELDAPYDYKVEAYGAPCSACHTLTWGGDCPNCYREDE